MVKRASNPEPKSSSNTTKKKQKKQQSLDSFFSVGKKKKASTSPTSVAESQGAKRKSSSIAESKAASTSATKCKHVKTPYTDGDGYPVITEPQQMFDDMVGGRLKKKDQRFLDMVKLTQHRPLRVATMCSGTESPLLALDMLQKSIQDACIEHSQLFDNAEPSSLFQLEHVFSCEIEPFKQVRAEQAIVDCVPYTQLTPPTILVSSSFRHTLNETFHPNSCFATFASWAKIMPTRPTELSKPFPTLLVTLTF